MGLDKNRDSCLWPDKNSCPHPLSHPCPSCDLLCPTFPSPKTVELGIKKEITISQFDLGFNLTLQFAS